MSSAIHPVLLCGDSGTRLWPLSRKSYPRQFVKLTGEESLYQDSARRLSGDGFAAPTIVTGSDFRFIVIEQLAGLEIVPADILIEPSARNTAAAICAAALHPARCRASHGKPWQSSPDPDRGADGVLSRGGRYHPLRGYLCSGTGREGLGLSLPRTGTPLRVSPPEWNEI